MPLTSFPNGLTTRVLSSANASAGSGALDCVNIYSSGTYTIASTGSFVGNGPVSCNSTCTVNSALGVVGVINPLIVYFSTSSALQTVYVPVPIPGSLDFVYVTCGSVSAVVANYTITIGSAGSVAVATVANTTMSSGVQQILTSTQTTYPNTSSLVCIRSAQGTAGDTSLCLLIRQTV